MGVKVAGEARSWPMMLTLRECAEFTGAALGTVRGWVKQGRLPRAPRVKRCVQFRDLLRFLDQRGQCPELWRPLIGASTPPAARRKALYVVRRPSFRARLRALQDNWTRGLALYRAAKLEGA